MTDRETRHGAEEHPTSLVGRVIGRVVSPVMDAVEPDDLLDRIDINELLDRIDVDALLDRIDVGALLDRIDVDRLMARVDVDALMARVDVDGVVSRVDVDGLMARVDVDGVVSRVDVDALMSRVDVEALLDRVDPAVLMDRIDPNALLDRLDLDTLLQRVDLAALVQRAGIEEIVRRSAGGLAGNALDLVRRQFVGVDVVVDRITDRVLGGGRAQGTDEVSDAGVTGRLAGPVSRLAAFAADALLITVSFSLGVSVLQFLAGLMIDRSVDLTAGDGIWWTLAFLGWAGFVMLVGPVLAGRTFGKALLGLRIVHTGDDPGAFRPITPRDALVRVLVFPVGFIFGLGFVGILVGRRHRGLHDLAASTVVVYDWGSRAASLPAPLARWLEQQVGPIATPPAVGRQASSTTITP